MKYVLDSSVAFKWVVTELLSDKARQIRHDFRNSIHELIAPDVFPLEIGHALTRAERQKRISTTAGWALWQSVMADAPRLHPAIALMPHAYAISSAARTGIYDCLYVALADREKCKLITADDKLINNLQRIFPCIVSLDSMP